MAVAPKFVLAPVGSTGNNTHPAVDSIGFLGPVAFQFVVEAVGGTPTVTFKFQGSMDGVNWYDIVYFTDTSDTLATAALTVTSVAAGTKILFLDAGNGSRNYNKFRCVTTSNTNVTYRAELYSFEAHVQ